MESNTYIILIKSSLLGLVLTLLQTTAFSKPSPVQKTEGSSLLSLNKKTNEKTNKKPNIKPGEKSAREQGWLFFEDIALKLPKNWRLLSQNTTPNIGTEILIGEKHDHYARFFLSGDSLKNEDFRERSKTAITQAKSDQNIRVMGKPEIHVFHKDGLRLDLRFEKEIRGRRYIEIHSPLVINGKGLDIFYVIPKAEFAKRSHEFEDLIKELSPYWSPHSPHSQMAHKITENPVNIQKKNK